MTLDEQSIDTPAIEDAIDRHPLMVPPETPLVEVIALMRASILYIARLMAKHRVSCVVMVDLEAEFSFLDRRPVSVAALEFTALQ